MLTLDLHSFSAYIYKLVINFRDNGVKKTKIDVGLLARLR